LAWVLPRVACLPSVRRAATRRRRPTTDVVAVLVCVFPICVEGVVPDVPCAHSLRVGSTRTRPQLLAVRHRRGRRSGRGGGGTGRRRLRAQSFATSKAIAKPATPSLLALPVLLLRRETSSSPRTSTRQGADVYAVSFVVPVRSPQTSARPSPWALDGRAQLVALGTAVVPYLDVSRKSVCLFLVSIHKYGGEIGLVAHAGVWLSSALSTLGPQTSAWMQCEPAYGAKDEVVVCVSGAHLATGYADTHTLTPQPTTCAS
jgi:hypothetical protein